LRRDVAKVLKLCRNCHLGKDQKQNTELYFPLPVPIS